MDVFASAAAVATVRDLVEPSVRFVDVVPGADTSSVDAAWLSADLWHGGTLGVFFAGLRAAPRVRWVHTSSAGTDGAGFDELRARGVLLTTSHVNATPIAEYVLAMVLRHYQRPGEWDAARRERTWAHHDFREVLGTTWLVIGLGAIGSEVATRARAFGARVIGVRRSPSGDEPVDLMVTPDALPDVASDADVVVLSRPASPGAPPIVDTAFLSAMRPGSVLVNVARGSLVDDAALLAALEQGVPEHAILDVFDVEPLPDDSPYWAHPRVTVTPHSANGGLGRYRRAAELFASNLDRFVRGELMP
jgi:phosphoglycerate dehydrogenase-like enzyme